MSTLTHCFSVEHALNYGVNEAILIHHIQFWIEHNRTFKRNFHDERTWMYQSQKEMAALYPYWTEDVIRKILKKLVDDGVLIKGNYNKTPFDRTIWYAFAFEEIFLIRKNDGMEPESLPNQFGKTTEPIPDTKTDTESNKGNVLNDVESLPFPNGKSKKKETPTQFPLKKEQQPTLELLQLLDLGCDDKTLMILIRSHPEQKILDAIAHFRMEVENGKELDKKPIAFFRYLLSEKVSLMGEEAIENKKWAQELKKKASWHSLEICNKHCVCTISKKEINFNTSKEEFQRRMKDSWELMKRS